ncbi:MAG: hypothetical protein MR694_00395, partial [Spirochaetia bacterium]|nr:hypothetical protein [Spirochaetia bacterium]
NRTITKTAADIKKRPSKEGLFSFTSKLSSYTVFHTVPIKEVIKIVAYATGGSAKYLIVLTIWLV